jgi:hypothetical protein
LLVIARVKNLLVVALVAVAAPAYARGDAVRVLERSVKYAKTPKGEPLKITGGLMHKIELRHDGGSDNAGVIVVDSIGETRGYFIEGRSGRVAAHERDELRAVVDGPHNRAKIVHAIRDALRANRAEVKRLATANPKIDAMLASLKDQPLRLHNGKVEYLPRGGSGMLIVKGRGIVLGGDAERGYTLEPNERAEVAEALLSRW